MTKKYFLAVFFFAVSIHSQLYAQWEKTNGPYIGAAISMIAVGNEIYTANQTWGRSDGNVYKSIDFGENWLLADSGMDDKHVNMFTNIGSTVFGAVPGDGLYRTTDGGNYWELVNNEITLSTHAKDSTLFIGLNGYGVHVSYDLGQTWHVRNNGFSAIAIVYDIEHIGNYVFCAQETGGADSARLYRSSNDGLLWTMKRDGLPPGGDIHRLVANDTTLFASMVGPLANYNYGIYRSTDYGESWQEVNTGIPYVVGGNTGEVFAVNGDLYISTTFPDSSRKVYKSTDNGDSWIQIPNGLRGNQEAFSFAAAGGYIFAGLGNYSTVFRTANGGAQWEEARRGIANGEILTLEQHNGVIYAGATEGLFYSSDGGENWTEMQNGLPFGLPVTAIQFNGSEIYIGTEQYGIYKSPDNGQSWVQSNAGITGLYSEYINDILLHNNTLYIATWDGIYKSTDNAATWTLASNGLPGSFGGSIVNVNTLTALGNDIFAGTTLEKIYKSSDGGATWALTGGSDFTVYSSTIRHLLTVGNEIYAATDDGVHKSTDQGLSWSKLNSGLTSMLASDGNLVFLSSHGPTVLTGYGIFVSADGGSTWLPFDDGMYEPSSVQSLLVLNDTIYGGTDTRSVWRRSTDITTSTDKTTSFANTIVYPNPSSGSAVIAYYLTESSSVSIRIIDVNGRLVRSDTKNNNAGRHQHYVQLPPGFYNCMLEADGKRESVKLIVTL